jgi:hypothetical protein
MLNQTFLGWKHTKTNIEAHNKWQHEECLPLSADTLKNTREAIRDSRECVRRRSDELIRELKETVAMWRCALLIARWSPTVPATHN